MLREESGGRRDRSAFVRVLTWNYRVAGTTGHDSSEQSEMLGVKSGPIGSERKRDAERLECEGDALTRTTRSPVQRAERVER